MSKVKSFRIRKIIHNNNNTGRPISVLLNDSLGIVLEFKTFQNASSMCEILNANSDVECRYQVEQI
tara:strand:- start:1054 stop:1251 length:198 start_codon:yes stop_codon:yes gene_type:complete